jgi:hypothetical protein
MRTFFLLLFFVGLTTNVLSQIYSANSYLTDQSGSMIRPNRNLDGVQGTPFLLEEWCKGEIFNLDGKVFIVERMRFNIAQNRIEYESGKQIYELVVPYNKFILNQSNGDGTFKARIFHSNFPAIDSQNTKTFYEVLYSGQSSFLRHFKVIVNEYAEPLSVTRVKRFRQISALYAYHPQNNRMVKISKGRPELMSLFADKAEVVQKFMDENHFKKKMNESDIIKTCTFYDGL